METTINTFSWSTLLWNLALSYGLKYLWNMINLLQFMVFISDWQLSYPKYGHAFLKYLKNLALMEFLPKDAVIDKLSQMLGLDEEDCEDCGDDSNSEDLRSLLDESESGFEQVASTTGLNNLGSKNLVRNLGIMLVLALGIVLLTLLLKLMSCLLNRFEWPRKKLKQLKDKLFYNMFIRYILQSTLKIQISACATIALTSWGTLTETSQQAAAIVILIIFCLWPLYFASVLHANYSNLGMT